ncbi:MAG: ORF6N domain-containing protein [Bacteroidia bacterium]|nr:ORF6N domain-containing protein [Bacteroidia bacterium]
MAKKTALVKIPDEVILSKIYFIRGKKVVLDRDLAELYGVETRRLNEQVRRNPKRFPPDFMFQLKPAELEVLMSQFATSSWGGMRKLPFVFTEHGILMLSSVLNSDRSIDVNLEIMRVFNRVRELIIDNTELRQAIEKLDRKSENHSKNIEVLFQYFDDLERKKKKLELQKKRKYIGYKVSKVKKK